jgi:hypothetical protein
LRKVSPELDTKKSLGVVVTFLDSLPQLLCWWFAWLEQLVKVLLSVNLWYRSTGVMYRRFPLAHEIIYGEFGAIERLSLKYALTPLPCQSHRDKWFEIHVFFVCHFVL